MPKTATGKVQRRLVAKTMTENEKRDEKKDSPESTPKADERLGIYSIFPGWLIRFFMSFFRRWK